MRDREVLPSAAEIAALKPSVAGGLIHTGVAAITLASGVWLALAENAWAYAGSQLLLAFFFVHAFVLLHEAGHDTLFPHRRLNRLIGHAAGFLTFLPFWNWQRIHARHHHYTGWQDLDATTAALVPHRIHPWERRIVNFAWATGLPLFAVLYRLQNYWNLPRIARYVSNARNMRRIRANTLLVLIAYTLLIAIIGPLTLLELIGPAFLLSLVLQEFLILSQHTHVPQHVSDGKDVRPFSPRQQEAFTRSLILPRWLSALLMHFDAHELHHMYPYVPGYRLRNIDYVPENEVHWWRWLKAVRGLKGTDFLFRNWNDTGVRV
ncbi:MAG: fatty acid desaturase [Gammaproteobacteria bacterium]|nr:fatty acid desaturase [Gammaproteobacteria bacterium]MDH4313424.1 fatty acid desaturase [Gammaproteobacteria bacterium]MDH5214055.1 fatty acid desaturase [Gammaproteobacteria bacterium]MDH5501031.1 fatty acid desaturase [Gammaproteobacteria bacterium]